MTHSKLKSQHNGKDPETDDICKGIDLDPEAFLYLIEKNVGVEVIKDARADR